MKKILKRILLGLLSNDRIGRFSYRFSTFAWKIKYQRELIERKRTEKTILELAEKLFQKKVVLHGPFKGMKYPDLRSKSSALYPKLLGTYEKELNPTIEEFVRKGYKQLLDIGCAEGYYAVGMAMRVPDLKVFAYDIDAEARKLTADMAKLNGVNERVHVEHTCNTETLKRFNFETKTAIICDAEGYEKHLFTRETISHLKNVDLLIETHDFIDINISTDLEKLFAQTHHITVIQSLGDVIKAKNYQVPELEGTDIQTRYRLLEEGRRFVDEWLLLIAKS